MVIVCVMPIESGVLVDACFVLSEVYLVVGMQNIGCKILTNSDLSAGTTGLILFLHSHVNELEVGLGFDAKTHPLEAG